MKINVSQVKTFLNDQLDWYYVYHLRRVPRRPEPALTLGTVWHAMLEELAKGASRDDAKKAGMDSVEAAVQQMQLEVHSTPQDVEDLLDDSEHLFNLFDHYEERYEFEQTLLVEDALEMPLPSSPHILLGRPDRVVRYQGKLWHVQNRTLSDRTVMHVYLAAAERDLHELSYAALIQNRFNIPWEEYGGTLMNICRKVSKKKLAEDPNAAFVQEFIPIERNQVDDALADIAQVADDMAAIIQGRRRAVQNRDCDKGRFGNRLSAYFPVRSGRSHIYDDHLYRTATSRYDDEPAVAA